MECTMVKQFLKSFKSDVSQMTRNAFKSHSACLEAAGLFLLRKIWCQGVQSTSSTREARPLTPNLARSNSN
ncbi:MAG TPA: hypothetical protein DIU09_07680 [Hyphomonadaceae bacterium]|nr:hypothetical protein AEM38_12190 [Hyphomonadaceae bacterium UKL13-1]HCP64454.1 hypothetical protein [Hyphomonadaceae bacterium]